MKTFWLVVILCGAVLANANHCSGFGYEILVSILETIQTDIQLVKSDVKGIQSKVNQVKDDQDKFNGEFNGHKKAMNRTMDQLMKIDIKAIRTHVEQLKNDQHKLNEQFTNNKRTINSKLDQLMKNDVQDIRTKVDQFKSDQDKLNDGISDNRRAINSTLDLLMNVFGTVQNCPENVTSGMYRLQLLSKRIIPVICDEGWIVIQRRLDGGSLSFNRNWTEYRDGFGHLQDDFWMGLETMYQITRAGSYELSMVIKTIEGQDFRSKFKTFKIASEADQYRLHVGNLIGGNAGDILTMYHSGMQFSTTDRDNDAWKDGHCAKKLKSGWWFRECSYVNLNGERDTSKFWWNGEPIYETQMMIRAVK